MKTYNTSKSFKQHTKILITQLFFKSNERLEKMPLIKLKFPFNPPGRMAWGSFRSASPKENGKQPRLIFY